MSIDGNPQGQVPGDAGWIAAERERARSRTERAIAGLDKALERAEKAGDDASLIRIAQFFRRYDAELASQQGAAPGSSAAGGRPDILDLVEGFDDESGGDPGS